MTPNQFADVESVRTFLLAGRAVFTLRSRVTGKRFTYRVQRSPNRAGRRKPDVHFVSVLTGQNNEEDYRYLGLIQMEDPATFRATRHVDSHVRHGLGAPSTIAFEWFARQLAKGVLPNNLEVWHEGRCGRCGRLLTVPESIATGFGPECAGRVVAHHFNAEAV